MAPALRILSYLVAAVACVASATANDLNHNLPTPRGVGPCTPIQPPPQNEPCDSRGDLQSPAISGDSQLVASSDDCRDLCSRHGAHNPKAASFPQEFGCYIFGYDETSSICSLYYKSLPDMGFTEDSSSSTVFNSMSCFNCPIACPEAIGTQLLDNAGFEVDSTLDGPWSTSGGIISAQGHDSNQSFACGSTCSLAQIVRVCANEIYSLSFAYKTAQSVKLSVYGGNLEGYNNQLPATGGDWGSAEYWFQSLRTGVTEVGLPFTNAQGLLVDDVAATRISGNFKPATGARELVSNGGFESDAIAPFQFQSGGKPYNYSIVSPGIDGSKHALKLVGHVTDNSDESYLNQRVNGLVPGTTYLLRFTAIKQGGSAEFPDVYIGGMFFDPPFQGGQRYNFSIPFQARTKSEALSIGYYYGPLLLDNISVKELA